MSAEAVRALGSTRKSCPGCHVSTELDARLSEVEKTLPELQGRLLASVEGLSREVRTALAVAGYVRAGVDVEGVTPLQPGQVELRASKNIRFRGGPLVLLAVVLALVGGYVAGIWGPPSKRVQVPTVGAK